METWSNLEDEGEAALGTFDLSVFEEQLLLAAPKLFALCSAPKLTGNDPNSSRSNSLYFAH